MRVVMNNSVSIVPSPTEKVIDLIMRVSTVSVCEMELEDEPTRVAIIL